jgi:hypothetical protein
MKNFLFLLLLPFCLLAQTDTLKTSDNKLLTFGKSFWSADSSVFVGMDPDLYKRYVDPIVRKVLNYNQTDIFSKVNLTERGTTQYYLTAKDQYESFERDNGLDIFNYSPLIIEQGPRTWEVKSWKQAFTYSTKPATTFYDGGNLYYFRPEYEADTNSQLMDFDLKFPDFTIPSGKTTILQVVPEREQTNNNYYKKGITFSRTGDLSKRFAFVSDDWLYSLGCPRAYASSQKEFDEWLEVTSARAILESFKRRILPFKDHGYVMLNWEAVANRAYGKNRYKLADCFKWFRKQNFHAQLSAWNESAFGFSRYALQYDLIPNEFIGLSTYKGTANGIAQRFPRAQPQPPDYAQDLDILQVGGYQNYPTDYAVIHHYLIEYLVNKQLFPQKKVLATIWSTQELVGNFPLARTDISDYYCYIKPSVFPQGMFNWGAWTVAVGDGFDCWYDPVFVTNDKSKVGYGCFRNDNSPINRNGTAEYPHNSLKNVDDLMAGVWAVSQHKDIIESNTGWKFPTEIERSFYDRTLLFGYKLSADKSEALILALDNFNGGGVNEHTINVNGKEFIIKTFGTRTSVIRRKL